MYQNFRRFLEDAGLIIQKGNIILPLAHLVKRLGLNSAEAWGLMLVNCSYSPQIGWYVKNIKSDCFYTKTELISMLQSCGVKDRNCNDITSSLQRILTLPFGNLLGLGKVTSEGTGKNKEIQFSRMYWSDPDSRVILYSLYKFAEACDGYYEFTLTRLMDHKIESAGISPTEIFCLDREKMGRLLNGMSLDYPEFIHASFTHDLDNIRLNADKKAEDVLSLFD
jgi:phosphoadenosine phosphosulfate reductase